MMGGWSLDMPSLRPLRRVPGPGLQTPFKHGQRVLVSNDKVIMRATILDPCFNIQCDEILRHIEWGCSVQIDTQEDYEGFVNDVMNFNRAISVCYSKGIWNANVYTTSRRADSIEIILRRA